MNSASNKRLLPRSIGPSRTFHHRLTVMEPSHRRTLDINLRQLSSDLDPIPLFPYLISKAVLKDDDREAVEKFPIRSRRTQEFIAILKTRGPTAFSHFLGALREEGVYDHLVGELERTAEREKDDARNPTDSTGLSDTHAYALKQAFEMGVRQSSRVRELVHHLHSLEFISVSQVDDLSRKKNERSMYDHLCLMLRDLHDNRFEGLLSCIDRLPDFQDLARTAREAIKEKRTAQVNEAEVISKMRYRHSPTSALGEKSLDSFDHIPEEVHIVLLGKTGSGKSATGNMVLGTGGRFVEYPTLSAGTKATQLEKCRIGGRVINVLDTPGLFDTDVRVDNMSTLLNIANVLLTFPAGIHVFLLVCRCDVKFTTEECETIDLIVEYFGRDLYRHTLLVFTRADQIVRTFSLARVVDEVDKLSDLVEKLSGRAVAIENKSGVYPLSKDKQRRGLLVPAIAEVVNSNKGKAFSNDLTRELDRDREIENHRENIRDEVNESALEAVITFVSRAEEHELRYILVESNPCSAMVQMIDKSLRVAMKSSGVDISVLENNEVTDCIQMCIDDCRELMEATYRCKREFREREFVEDAKVRLMTSSLSQILEGRDNERERSIAKNRAMAAMRKEIKRCITGPVDSYLNCLSYEEIGQLKTELKKGKIPDSLIRLVEPPKIPDGNLFTDHVWQTATQDAIHTALQTHVLERRERLLSIICRFITEAMKQIFQQMLDKDTLQSDTGPGAYKV